VGAQTLGNARGLRQALRASKPLPPSATEGGKRFAAQFGAEVNIPKIEAILAEAAGRA